jgi:hypothetical protein
MIVFAFVYFSRKPSATTQGGPPATQPAGAEPSQRTGTSSTPNGTLAALMTNYVAAVQSGPEGSDTDQQLREKIISLAQKTSPTPTVSEEARRHFVMGTTYMKEAKTPHDYYQAISVYKKALLIAPWFGDAYYNLGIASEASGN